MRRMLCRVRDRSGGSEARALIADVFVGGYVDCRQTPCAVEDSSHVWLCAGREGFGSGSAVRSEARARGAPTRDEHISMC